MLALSTTTSAVPSLTLSSFDPCTALTDTVGTLQRPALKVSWLFLDIKGVFDNVDANIFCSSLHSKVVDQCLISLARSFLTGWSCRLLFQGSPRIFSPVSVGTPQGSPVSPLLFVIYVAPLNIPLDWGLVLSYVDDFSLTVSCTSYHCNCRSLQAAFGRIRAIAHSRQVDFSVPKTELIHWRTPLQQDPAATTRPPPVALDGQIFHLSPKLQWLGYWLVPNLASSAHFSPRLALFHADFSSVQRLADAGKGISPHLCNRLPYCLMFPILSYGANLFTPSKGLLSMMEVHWRQVHKWVTNAYGALKRRAQSLMMDKWRSIPLPGYYPFPLRLSPPPFMGLGKFLACCIHQMRFQKSYLAAHPPWFNADDSPLGPLCGDEPETFSHAILRCPAKASARTCHLQGISSVDHDAPLWASSSLLLSLTAFIRATDTGFPPDILPSLPPSPPSMVFPSSPVGPAPVDLLASPPQPPLCFLLWWSLGLFYFAFK